MKKVLTLSLLALSVSHGALAANYALNNDNMINKYLIILC